MTRLVATASVALLLTGMSEVQETVHRTEGSVPKGVVAEQGNGASYEQDNGATGAGQPCPGRRAHTTTLLGTQ